MSDLFTVNSAAAGDKKTRDLIRGLTEEAIRLEAKARELVEQASAIKADKRTKIDSVISLLVSLDTKTIKWEDNLAVTRKVTMHPRIPPEHSAEFKTWLKRNRYWGLANIPSNTIKSLLKERLEKGQKIPAYVESFEEQGLSISGKAAVLMDKEPTSGSSQV